MQDVVDRRPSERALEFIALSDEELAHRTYSLVERVEDNRLSDEFYWLLTEMVERWAPNAEWMLQLRHAAESWPNDREQREGELGATRDGILSRAAARALARMPLEAVTH